MAKCPYCGESAGVFRKQHDECAKAYAKAQDRVRATARAALAEGGSLDDLQDRLRAEAAQGRLPEPSFRNLLVSTWEDALEAALDDGILTDQEEEALSGFIEATGLEQEELNRRNGLQRMVVASVLRSLTAGDLPQRCKVDGAVPFNLQRSETLVWVFPNTTLYEERTRRQYVGGYSGVSVRIARGLYYRTGAFKGHPVDTSFLQRIDSGALGLTDKHLYFHGGAKGFRLPYKKIASFDAHEDGITVQKEAVSAKPLILQTGDGWSTYNLVMNLAQRGQ